MIGLDDLGHFDAVIPRIGASATAYGAAIIRQFEAMGVFVTVTAEALLKARDKLHCMQILSAVGIDVPKTGVSAKGLFSPEQFTIEFLRKEQSSNCCPALRVLV